MNLIEKKLSDTKFKKNPKIIYEDGKIFITTSVLNYSFLTNFLPLIAGIFLLIIQNGILVNIKAWLLIIISLSLFISQAVYYNKIEIDLNLKLFEVKPNLFMRLLMRKIEIIHFNEIKTFEFEADGARIIYRRFLIRIILKSGEKIKLTNTKERENAELIIDYLKSLIINYF